MKRLFGNTGGLKANQLRQLGKLYHRRNSPEHAVSFELAKEISRLSGEIRRQIGLLIDRSGRVIWVIVGDHRQIVIPDVSEYRLAAGRLRGLRCVHTHLNGEPLSKDDLTDLALLRLDMMGVVSVENDGQPPRIFLAHILPGSSNNRPYQLLPPFRAHETPVHCLQTIRALEDELATVRARQHLDDSHERALLVSVTTDLKSSGGGLDELRELADSSGITVVGEIVQQRRGTDSRFLLGRGKLEELTIAVLAKGATLIIFDQELNPSQIRSITNQIDIKVVDRTMLILDIFAQRAQSREGKLQVELAQLKYLLPRLATKNTAMSRLTGGIGGRGPGETKLEINRRRTRDRIVHLEKSLGLVRKQRKQRRARRNKRQLPIISIVGYTNAGKSTLLNTLTKSRELVENRLFATLDPSSRRLRFPRDIEVIITDTVGFITDLPRDLVVAFRATLEELESADLLLHVIDISNPRFMDQIQAVESIVTDLQLQDISMIRVLNKQDLVDPGMVSEVARRLGGIPVSAIRSSTLLPLLEEMQRRILQIPSL